MFTLGALKVAAFMGALGLLLYVMVRWRISSLTKDEKRIISLSDSDYLMRSHFPLIVMTSVAMLCGSVAVVALMVSVIAWVVGV